jgi:hypothetical protein
VPSYRFIGGRERLSTTFTIFLAEIPAGFAGVKDVSIEGGQIAVMPRDGGTVVRVRARN